MKLSAIQRFTMLDFPDKVTCIAFTPGCNMRCGFCHNPEFVLLEKLRSLQGSFISEETFINFLEKRRGKLEGVVVSGGGEPTIWQDLPDFFRKIKEKGFLAKLDINGHHPAMLRQLLADGLLDYVAMDVKTALSGYTKLVGGGVKGEQIAESMALLKVSGIPYEFRTTLVKEIHTEEVLAEMEDLLRGAERYYLQTFRSEHTLDPLFANYHPFSLEEMGKLVERFSSVACQVGIRL